MISPAATTAMTAAATAISTLCSSIHTHAVPVASFTTRHVVGKAVRAQAPPLDACTCTHRLNSPLFSCVRVHVFPMLHEAHSVASPAFPAITGCISRPDPRRLSCVKNQGCPRRNVFADNDQSGTCGFRDDPPRSVQ